MSGKYRFTKIYKKNQQDNPPDLELIPGKLGLTIGGFRQVEIPSRPGYVWVRLRGDLSESIQAYNAAVSPVYGLPVLVRRDRANKSRYSIVGKDDGAYQSWGNNASSYLPRHGATHSFDPNAPGGDVTWVWGNQFMPLAVTPSGTSGAMSVLIQPGTFYQNDAWHYLGAIGTSSLDSYKPTGSSARMVLVYLDDSSDPAYELGTSFDASITGTSQVMQYIPNPPTTTSIPLAGIRLVSGSSYLSWDNIYDLRGFLTDSSSSSGSSSGGGHIIAQEYTPLPQRATLNFDGLFTVSDDEAGNATNIIASSSAGSIHKPVTLVSGSITNDFSLPLLSQELDYIEQEANTVFAGPVSGSNAKPSFRALTSSDISGGAVLPTFGANQVVYADDLGTLVGSPSLTYDIDGTGRNLLLISGTAKAVGLTLGDIRTNATYNTYALNIVADYNVDYNYYAAYIRQYEVSDVSIYFQRGSQTGTYIVENGDHLLDTNIYGYAVSYTHTPPTPYFWFPKVANVTTTAANMFSGTASGVMKFNILVSGTPTNQTPTNILNLYGDRIEVLGKAKLGDIVGANYTEILSDGTLRLHGTATAWDDLRVAADATKLGGSNDPGYAVFKTNGAGSQGIFTYWFDNVAEEEVYFSVQMPHSWKLGSTIYPHVHWTPSTTGTAGQQVVWGLEYSWANTNEFFPNTTIINTSGTSIGDNTLAGAKHYLSSYPPITAVGKTLSSMILCRLFRNVDDPDDDYAADAGLLEFDVHYEIDSFGSENEFTKV